MAIVKKNKMKMLYAAIFSALVLGLWPAATLAATPPDTAGHWAEAQIADWVAKGLIQGYPDGTFRPDQSVTRAEFMALINGAFGYDAPAAVNYKDVPTDAWFYATVARARAAGYVAGYEDGTMRPNNPITRAEAAAMVMRVKGLAAAPEATAKFADAAVIPAWSKGAVGAVLAAGIMSGYPDGSFRAQDFITRAEAVVALDKAWRAAGAAGYDKPGVYGPAAGTATVNGDVTIKAGGVTLQNTVIAGNLTVDRSVGEGDVTLKNVTVRGTTYIYGGGANSVHLVDTRLARAVVLKAGGSVRILASGNAEVGQLVAQSSVKVEAANISGKGFVSLVVDKKVEGNIEVSLVGAKVETLEIKSQEATVRADKNTAITALDVKADNVTIATEKGTTIATLVASGKVAVTGAGTVQTARVNVSGVSFETKPQNQEVAPGVTAPVTGTAPTTGSSGGGGSGSSSGTSSGGTTGGSSGSTGGSAGGTTGGSSGSSGGTTGGGSEGGTGGGSSGSGAGESGSQAIAIQPISNLSLYAGDREDVTVTTNPADAAVAAVSGDADVAAVSVNDHTVTVEGHRAGSATITVTAAKSGYTSASTTFTVTVRPGRPASFQLGAATGSLYIDLSSFADAYSNPITWDDLTGTYGLDLTASRIYFTSDAQSTSSAVYATLAQLMTKRVPAGASGLPEAVSGILAGGGTVLHFSDQDVAAIWSGNGVDGMFAGFNPAMHKYVYAALQGSFQGDGWQMGDGCAMPAINGAQAIEAAQVEVTPGSIHYKYSFTAGGNAVTYDAAQGAPYYLDTVSSQVYLAGDGGRTSSPLSLADLHLDSNGQVSYASVADMVYRLQMGPDVWFPTQAVLYLQSKTQDAGNPIINPWQKAFTAPIANAPAVFQVVYDADNLQIFDASGNQVADGSTISGDLRLAYSGDYSAIEWTASDQSAVSIEYYSGWNCYRARVNRPVGADANVTLTATLTAEDGDSGTSATYTKEFTLTIKAREKLQVAVKDARVPLQADGKTPVAGKNFWVLTVTNPDVQIPSGGAWSPSVAIDNASWPPGLSYQASGSLYQRDVIVNLYGPASQPITTAQEIRIKVTPNGLTNSQDFAESDWVTVYLDPPETPAPILVDTSSSDLDLVLASNGQSLAKSTLSLQLIGATVKQGELVGGVNIMYLPTGLTVESVSGRQEGGYSYIDISFGGTPGEIDTPQTFTIWVTTAALSDSTGYTDSKPFTGFVWPAGYGYRVPE